MQVAPEVGQVCCPQVKRKVRDQPFDSQPLTATAGQAMPVPGLASEDHTGVPAAAVTVTDGQTLSTSALPGSAALWQAGPVLVTVRAMATAWPWA